MIHSVMLWVTGIGAWFAGYVFWRLIAIIILFMSGVCESQWSEKQRNINILIEEYQVRPEFGEYLQLHLYRAVTFLFIAFGSLVVFVGI